MCVSSLSAAEVQEGMSRTVQWLLGYSWREAGEGGERGRVRYWIYFRERSIL